MHDPYKVYAWTKTHLSHNLSNIFGFFQVSLKDRHLFTLKKLVKTYQKGFVSLIEKLGWVFVFRICLCTEHIKY